MRASRKGPAKPRGKGIRAFSKEAYKEVTRRSPAGRRIEELMVGNIYRCGAAGLDAALQALLEDEAFSRVSAEKREAIRKRFNGVYMILYNEAIMSLERIGYPVERYGLYREEQA